MMGRVLVLYHSYGGNTRELAELIGNRMIGKGYSVDYERVMDLNRSKNYDILFDYDILLIGSNTWGEGEMPEPVWRVVDEISSVDNVTKMKDIITGVFGTGESSYRHYCASVEYLRDALYPISNLAVTIKVEQLYTTKDVSRIDKFVDLVEARDYEVNEKSLVNENVV